MPSDQSGLLTSGAIALYDRPRCLFSEKECERSRWLRSRLHAVFGELAPAIASAIATSKRERVALEDQIRRVLPGVKIDVGEVRAIIQESLSPPADGSRVLYKKSRHRRQVVAA